MAPPARRDLEVMSLGKKPREGPRAETDARRMAVTSAGVTGCLEVRCGVAR